MIRLFKLALLSFVVLSCKLASSDQKANNELESTESNASLTTIASEFPAVKLDALVESITQDELNDVINEGQSEHWTRTVLDANRRALVIKNKLAGDNSVRFVLYGTGPHWAIIAVQQNNAQVAHMEVWEYHDKVNEDHPEQWNQYLLPEYKLDSFFDEKVRLPKPFHDKEAEPYLDYELTPATIKVNLNKWVFMRELESNFIEPGGALDPALVKYYYALNWNGDSFEEQKVKEAGYNDVLTFTSETVDDPDYGPGPHEFDCPHGVTVKASSSLPRQGSNTYNASNILDKTDATAWAEGVQGDGVGQWIEFTITGNYHIGDTWQIMNGYGKNKETWQSNGRVKKMKVFVGDQLVGYVMLANASGIQQFNISPAWLIDAPELKVGSTIRFVIDEVYAGSKYDDTAISYFVPTGNCG